MTIRWWVRHELSPSAFSGLVASPHVCPVYSSCKGYSQGWMSKRTCALGSLPGLSLPEFISASTPPQEWCAEGASMWEQSVSSCPWRPAWLQILVAVKEPLAFFTHLLSQPWQLVSRDWPDLGQRLRAAGPRVSAPHRTQCSIQTALPLLPTPQSCSPCDLSSNFRRSHSSHPSKAGVNRGWCSVYMRLPYLWKLRWTPSG